jgi:hypothetical protein
LSRKIYCYDEGHLPSLQCALDVVVPPVHSANASALSCSHAASTSYQLTSQLMPTSDPTDDIGQRSSRCT